MEFFGIPVSSDKWLVKETSFGLDAQHIQESLFTLGNGFIGSRGVLEELPERAMPGTFIAGVYDKSGSQVEELVNLPNPIHFIIASEGEKLDMRFMEFTGHLRCLDMKKAMLARRTVFKDAKGRKFLYKSVRFFSMHNPHIGCMKISLTLLHGKKAQVTALDFLDDSQANTGGLIYGSRRHVRLMDASVMNHVNYYAYRTHTSHIWIAYADHLSVERQGQDTVLDDRVYNFEIQKSETITFTKMFAISSSLQCRVRELKQHTLNMLGQAVQKGFKACADEHIQKWQDIWKHADIVIKGDMFCEKALRFNIYHLLTAGYRDRMPVSIGARALTGQGYRGHVFWDAEIFLLPFYIYQAPQTAKDMLLYRYERLEEAKKNALKKGYKGALFPWESAAKGDEATPRYAKDIDGGVIKIDTMDLEQHICADVAYGVFNYLRATADKDFLIRFGAEMVFETARFWASRARFNLKRKKYEIAEVTGPDEFHFRVKNNAYTNIMASWNMRWATAVYYQILKDNFLLGTGILKRFQVNKKEVSQWEDIAANMYVPVSSDSGLTEQFEGYFKKKEFAVKSYDNHFMPEAPRHLSYADFNKTKFIKQADTLLLFHLLPDEFTQDEKRQNYKYYIKRTLHQSSLSHSTHAIICAELKDIWMAYIFLLFALNVDLKNLHNNTDGGMHMASVGGVWQSIVFGFAGLWFDRDMIFINPRLPGHWKCIQFSIWYKGSLFSFKIAANKVSVTYYPSEPRGEKTAVTIFNKKYELTPGVEVMVKNKQKEPEMKRIKDIMKEHELIFIREDTPVKHISRMLIEKNINAVPVVNENEELKGIISEKDLLKMTQEADFSAMTARDVMKTDVEYVKEDDHVEIAIRLFTERPYRLLPVLRANKVVGIITRREILSACSGEYY